MITQKQKIITKNPHSETRVIVNQYDQVGKGLFVYIVAYWIIEKILTFLSLTQDSTMGINTML